MTATLTVRRPHLKPHRTFTRAEITRALDEAGRPWIAEGVYSRPDHGGRGFGATLALDYDDPGDLGFFVVAVAALLGQFEGRLFAGSMDYHRDSGHPRGDSPGLRCAYWPGFALDEPTGEQWDDERNDCLACREGEDHGIDCATHVTAPWDAVTV